MNTKLLPILLAGLALAGTLTAPPPAAAQVAAPAPRAPISVLAPATLIPADAVAPKDAPEDTPKDAPAGAQAPSPAPAPAPGFLPNLYDVTVVETWDRLNVRQAPDGQAKVVGTLPSTAKGIELLKRDASGKWGRVNVGEGSGWVALRFLKPQPSVWKPAALPLALNCAGTEPFWSIRTVEKGLVFAEPDAAERQLSLRKVMDRGIEGEPTRGIVAGDDKGRLTAFLRPAQCSDGMSDRGFALAVAVILDGQDMPSRMLSGCCSIAAPKPAKK